MTTETAQRRLLEALADIRNTPDLDAGEAETPLVAVVVGVRWAQLYALKHNQPALARIYGALADLATAVNDEQTRETSR